MEQILCGECGKKYSYIIGTLEGEKLYICSECKMIHPKIPEDSKLFSYIFKK